ncbi:MAG: hypothetical protein PF574_06255 [Candidatus Delongbacteria bacterium]|jgi:hypothetical protein|nr:hypothetical protein [Candidatus Delongbacteria bacterium]
MTRRILLLFVIISGFVLNLFALDIDYTYIVDYDHKTINGDVHVLPGGSIMNSDNSPWTLTINGNLINEGSIVNNPVVYTLSVELNGDLTNSGTISCTRFTMIGSSANTINSSSPITSDDFFVTNPAGLVASGDIEFSTTDVDFNNYNLDLNAGYDLILNDGYISDAVITGVSTSEINLSNTAYLQRTNITDCSLNGTVEIASGVEFYGDVINNGIMQNYSSSPYTLIINGNIINNGSIQDNTGSSLTVYAYGDVINHSTWNCYRLDLKGTTPQTLSLFNSAVFNTTYLSNFNTTSILSGTDLSFLNTSLDFNDNTLELTSGFDLVLVDGYIEESVITGTSDSEINLSNTAYISYSDITDCSLNGTVEIRTGVNLYGNVINYGILQNYSSSPYVLTINGNITNYGSIQDNTVYSLTVDSYGDITNNSTWNCYRLDLKGTAPQTLSLFDSAVFNTTYFSVFNATSIISGTDLTFVNTFVDFNNNALDLTSGFDLILDDGYLTEAVITGISESEINLSNTAYLQNTEITDCSLNGIVQIGTGVKLYGEIANNGIIQNYSGSSYTLTINGNITNNGLIQDNPGGSFLIIDTYKNITNNGIWTNYYTKLVGTTDQNILIMNNSSFQNHYFSMFSEFTTEPLQWYFDGAILDSPICSGETSVELYTTDIAIDSLFNGTYYCETGDGPSRNIIISSMVYESPTITDGSYGNGIINMFWDDIPTAISYNIYSSDDPYSLIHTWTFETEVFTNSCTILDQTEQKRFYFIRAVY